MQNLFTLITYKHRISVNKYTSVFHYSFWQKIDEDNRYECISNQEWTWNLPWWGVSGIFRHLDLLHHGRNLWWLSSCWRTVKHGNNKVHKQVITDTCKTFQINDISTGLITFSTRSSLSKLKWCVPFEIGKQWSTNTQVPFLNWLNARLAST